MFTDISFEEVVVGNVVVFFVRPVKLTQRNDICVKKEVRQFEEVSDANQRRTYTHCF